MSSRIYICTSVLVDYTLYLKKCIEWAGYNVKMVYLIGEGEYRKSSKSNSFRKMLLRCKMYFFYPIKLMFYIFTARPESVFIITSNTFFAPCIAGFIRPLRNHKIINLVYDLFPDVIEVAGKVKKNSVIVSVLSKITQLNLKISHQSVYLGKFLKSHAESRWGKFGPSTYIDISADADQFKPNLSPSSKIIIHYGGQLGYLHDADTLIQAVHETLYNGKFASHLSFNFRVSGANAQKLETFFNNDSSIEILPPIPSEQWREEVRNHHIGLVSLSPGGATVCLPSKCYAMMAAGLAIIAICPRWSDLGQAITTSNAGWVIDNSPYIDQRELEGPDYITKCYEHLPSSEVASKFQRTIETIIQNPRLIEEKRQNALDVMHGIYSKEFISKRWNAVIQGTIKS